MADKLSVLAGVQALKKARKQVRDNPTYRLGQALYNLTPKDLLEEYQDETNYAKWYNTLDEVFAVTFFAEKFVDSSIEV